MTYKTSNIVAGLRAAAHTALHYVQRRIGQSADAANRVAAQISEARRTVRAAFAAPKTETSPGAIPAAQADAGHGLHVDGLHSQLDLLAEHFAEQARTLESLDVHAPAAVVVAPATLEGELEALRTRVRQRHSRIAARSAAQSRSARNVETRARRLEQRLGKLREGRRRLLALDLAIAGADDALMRAQVELEEAGPQLAASERALTECAKESALLRERDFAPAAARDLARSRVERIRAKLAPLHEQAATLHAHDVMAWRSGATNEAQLRDRLARLNHAADELDAFRDDAGVRDRAAHSITPPSESATPKLDGGVLRAPLERRLRLLAALGEIRVEETQLLHAAIAEHGSHSRAALARVSGTRVRLLLDEAERAWLLEALEAVGHEQSARLSREGRDAGTDAGLENAVTAWRCADERLEDAGRQTRAAQLELASLRSGLAPVLARAEAEAREQSARIRERQSTLRTRRRSSERAASKLRLARQRGRVLAKKLQRARDAFDHALAQVGAAAIAGVLGRLAALEREVETTAAAIEGLNAAHDQVVRAMTGMERELLDLSLLQRAAAPTAVLAPPAADPGALPSEASWTRARMELDIAALTDELERSNARHARLEERVDAQARLLASLESAQRDDEALAELRLDLEHAWTSAAASLERALAPAAGSGAPGSDPTGDGAEAGGKTETPDRDPRRPR